MKPTDRINELRRKGDFQGARRLGEELLASGEADESAVSALLIDIYLDIQEECQNAGVTAYIPEIEQRIDTLTAEHMMSDRQEARRRALRNNSLPGYADIQALDELSLHDGCEQEAYTKVRAILTEQAVDPRLHEMVALIFYRYLRACYTAMESSAARRVLADYLALTVPRPSRVHSLMLRMAVRVARRFPDFNFARFFRLWDPRTLRPEDIETEGDEGSQPVSLAVSALARVVDSPQAAELSSLLELLPATREVKASVMRDTFFLLTRKAIEADDSKSAIDLLTLYASNCAMHSASRRHSSMLGMALRVMTGSEEWRFPEFFIQWDASYLRPDDFLPHTASDGRHIPSTASRAMSRCFTAVKNDLPRFAYLLPALIRSFDTIAESMPGGADELLERRRAMLLTWAECEDTAVDRLSALARRPEVRSARFWLDFADILQPRMLKMGMIALGLIRSNSDDPDIQSLRLSLAQLLHFEGRDDNAALELRLYTDTVESKAAEPSARYGAIAATIDPDAIASVSNEMLYHTLAAEALDLIYSNLPSQSMTVIEADDRRLTLSSGSSQAISIDTRAWPITARLHPGSTLDVRIDSTGRVVSLRPVDRPAFDSLPTYYGIVTGLDPLTIQCAGKAESVIADTDARLALGQTVTFRLYRDPSGTRRAINPQRADIAEARRHFDHIRIAPYRRNNDGSLDYSAGPELEPGTIPAEFAAGIDLYKPAELYFYRGTDGRRRPVSVAEAISPDDCPALKALSGPLRCSASGQWSVRDVTVPPELLESGSTDDGTYVSVTAIFIPRTSTKPPYWRALAISTY
ncbi:MAG: hypothetical protein K2I64_01400 [Muribaculaceae bacterium]|nr:hypothetical protein [Muribaculaceae bacterium]